MFRHKGYRIFLMLVLGMLLVVGCTSNAEEDSETATNENAEAEGNPVDEEIAQTRRG